MQEPPEDFMTVSQINWQHDYRRGNHGQFFWLRSRQIDFTDFFDWVQPPADGFRLLVTAVDGGRGAALYGLEEGWTFGKSYGLSPVLHSWPRLVATGNGEALFILDAFFNSPNIDEILKEFEDLDGYEDLDDFGLQKIQKFWHGVQELNPIFYICQWTFFSLVSRTEVGFAEFIENASFRNIECKAKQDAIAQRISLWNYYWNLLGPERGPETCINSGCDRLRIELAVRCLRHQLESNNPTWFGSERYFNPTVKRLDVISVAPSNSQAYSTNAVDKNRALIKLADSDKVQYWREPFEIQSVPQKIFSTVQSVQDEVYNGGFALYFASSSETASFAVTAFETIGATIAAGICKRAIRTAFPEGLPGTPDAIANHAQAHWAELAEKLAYLDQEFFNCPDDLTELVFQFVKKHPDEFGVIG